MAFLNGKYTAFDPQITIEGVVDDENNCVVTAEEITFFSSSGKVRFGTLDKTTADIQQAVSDGKTIWVKYTAPAE